MKLEIEILLLTFSISFHSSSSFNLQNDSHVLFLSNSVSKECSDQYAKLDLNSKQKLLDASGKFPSGGLLVGNFHDLGHYDECLSVGDDSNEIYGKYCLAHPILPFENVVREKLEKNLDFSEKGLGVKGTSFDLMTIGVCVPNKCTSDDTRFSFDENSCTTIKDGSPMETKAMIALVIIYVLLIVALASTLYDLYIEYNDKRASHDILVAFSIYTNGKKLLKTSLGNGQQLDCLNGIKTISMMWVVLGHVYANAIIPGAYSTCIDNFFDVFKWKNGMVNMLILSAPLSVDTFFTLGGLLTVYVYMRSSENLLENLKKVPLLYLHRYLRLTPAFAMMIMIYATGLFKYFGNGPLWSKLDSSETMCQDNWWSAILYIQNYVGDAEMCVGQSWYLSVDFQLFLLTPLVLIPLKKYPKMTLMALHFLAIIGIIIPFLYGYIDNMNGIGLGMLSPSQFMSDYYYATHTRFAPYVIGMIAGYYIFKLKQKEWRFSLANINVFILWTIAIVLMLVCIFDGHAFVVDQKFPTFSNDEKFLNGLYMGLNRPLWSCAVSLVVILCTTGNGGIIDRLLSLPAFQILSKLSYSIYLIHYIVILMINASMRTTWHFSNFTMTSQFLTHFAVTLFFSVILCLVCESPMIVIERIVFKTRRKNERENLGEIQTENNNHDNVDKV